MARPLWGDKKPEGNASHGQRITCFLENRSENAETGVCIILFPKMTSALPP